ncbi:MAG TPA: NUDIX domain-containing protein, partial [Kineosporiaceae bacterium]|nr:NUDIX domain-containing protein [Kineosporiaceae bacterium]
PAASLKRPAVGSGVGPAKPVRAPEGLVTAIVAVTGTVDEVNDLIVPGAFTVTLSRRRPKVVHHHDWKKDVGRVLSIEEWKPGDKRLPALGPDGKAWPAEAGALVAVMQFNLRTQRGREAWEMASFYASSGEACWSIGYKVIPGMASKRGDGVRIIYGLELFEISPVLHGAHPLTMALEVKSVQGGHPDGLERKTTFAVQVKASEQASGRGAMIALIPPSDVAQSLAVADGTDPEHLHVTIACLPDGEYDAGLLEDLLRPALTGTPTLTGSVGGLGQFPAGPQGVPVFVPVDVPGLNAVYEAVIGALRDGGIDPASNHGYTPHCTLGYDVDASPVPQTDVEFPDVWIVLGDERRPIPLTPLPASQEAGVETKSVKGRPVAAGIAVVAKDTGRTLMLQRALDDPLRDPSERDPAAGTWEFPGGTLEDREAPRDAAIREWQEETGTELPSGQWGQTWQSPDGVYVGHVYVIPVESAVSINPDPEGRAVVNPDDPDGDNAETVAWWDPHDAAGNPALRTELAADPDLWLPRISGAGVETKTATRLVAEALAGRFRLGVESKAGGADRDRGGAENLRKWFTHGAGATVIGWGVPGDHERCVAIASKHMTVDEAHGYCQLREKEATGLYTAQHAALVRGEGKAAAVVAAALKVPAQNRMELKAMAYMLGSFEERRDKIAEAARELLFPPSVGDDNCHWVTVTATFEDHVIVEADLGPRMASYQIPYSLAGEQVTLGIPVEVELSLVAVPEGISEAPAEEVEEAVQATRLIGPAVEGLLGAAARLGAAPLQGKALAAEVRDPLLTLLDRLAAKGVDVTGMVLGDGSEQDDVDPDDEDPDPFDEELEADPHLGTKAGPPAVPPAPAGPPADEESDPGEQEPDTDEDDEADGNVSLDPADVRKELDSLSC